MEVANTFDSEIRVPAIDNLPALLRVVREVGLFERNGEGEQAFQRARTLLEQAGFAQEGHFSIGVKKLLSLIEMARQDPEPGKRKSVSSSYVLLCGRFYADFYVVGYF
jgi:vesicle-fusing ATPase